MQDIRTTQSLRRQIHASPKVQELRRKKQKKRRTIVLIIFLVLAFLVGGLVGLSHIKYFHIQEVVISGNEITDTEDLREVVDASLRGNYILVFPKRQTFLYSKKDLEVSLREAFPRLLDISIEKKRFQKLEISVSEIRGHALWCGVYPSEGPCYFTDNQGVIVDTAPMFSGNIYTRFFTSTTFPEPIGTSFIDPQSYEALMSFRDGLASLGFSIYGIVLGDVREHRVIIQTTPTHKAEILFPEMEDYTLLVANLQATLAQEDVVARYEKDRAYLEYFDLRFTNKVYYKFSNE